MLLKYKVQCVLGVLHQRHIVVYLKLLGCLSQRPVAILLIVVIILMQVLGRNLEALVSRAQEIKADWKDEYVSVEHMLLAFLDDAKFGTKLLKDANLDKAKLDAAIKEIRGSNRVTDQVLCSSPFVRSSRVKLLAAWELACCISPSQNC